MVGLRRELGGVKAPAQRAGAVRRHDAAYLLRSASGPSDRGVGRPVGSVRPGGHVGFVGAPSGALPTGLLFGRNLHYAGGVAPVRHYLPELLADVLNGSLRPGAVFDTTMTLDQTPDAYAAMDARTAIKVLLRP